MLLQALSEAVGVSGDEAAVRQVVLDAIKDHVEDIRIDAMGSITALKKGTGENLPRVMIDAHMDEIGFMVTGVDGNGLLRFTNVGGVDDRILPGLRVKVGKDLIPGVIIWTPIHMNRDQNVTKLKNLRIDIGATGKDGVGVKPGDRVAFDTQFMEIGEKTLRGKAFDDRVGCSLLIDILQGGPYAVDVLAAFTVQEEIGLRGARVAAQSLQPDAAIALEGTTAHDLPNPSADPDDEEVVNPACKLGSGPVLTIMDRSMITHPGFLNFLKQTATDNDIPFQYKTQLGGGTDAGGIHVTDGGIPSAVISMPCRYIHSPAALLNRDDYANTLKLVQTALDHLTFEAITHV